MKRSKPHFSNSAKSESEQFQTRLDKQSKGSEYRSKINKWLIINLKIAKREITKMKQNLSNKK